jgi:ferritin-like metal-binding protein YciE
MNNLREALINELKDVLSAEQQITKALPKMVKNAKHPKLRAAFEEHLEQTNDQIDRLEQVFQKLNVPVKAEKCDGIAGIIEQGEKLLKKQARPEVLDAILIAEAQKVEHYEIASYGTMCAWAEQLGDNEICDLLNQSLEEEKATDERLTKLASSVNPQAVAV